MLRIAIVGDFKPDKPSHWATEAALFHAAAELGHAVEPRWVSTPEVLEDAGLARLAGFDGVLGAPGSPWRSVDGMLRAIRHARERGVPYLGTCAGFQNALIELSRNVLGIADADSADNAPDAAHAVISPIRCQLPDGSGPGLVGQSTVRLVEPSQLSSLCAARELQAEFFCSLEPNPNFVERWERAGLRVSARGPDGEMRAFELPAHRFFVATLFQPQLSSRPERAHPIVRGFLQACAARPA